MPMDSVAHALPARGTAPKFSVLLGVVYGDIGTSPLYAFKSCLDLLHGHAAAEWEVLGLLSLVLIVTVKYVLLVMGLCG